MGERGQGGRLNSLSALLAILALVVRSVYFVIIRHRISVPPDSGVYMGLGNQIADGAAYALRSSVGNPFPIALIQPPGHPTFIALAEVWQHLSPDRVALVQIFLGAVSVAALTYLVGRWLGTLAGVLAGLMLALDWTTGLYTPLVLADFLLSLLLASVMATFIVFLIRHEIRWALISGVLLGLATLVKPAAEFGALVLLIAILTNLRANWRGLVFPYLPADHSSVGALQ